MTLQDFADKYKLKVKRDSCDDPIIPGRVKGAKRPEDAHHIFEGKFGGQLLVYFNFPTVGRWNTVKKKLDQPGVFPLMICKYDGFMSFDALNEPLVKLILKLAKIRTKRQLSPEQKDAIRQRFKK
jgi:hypothetical protein